MLLERVRRDQTHRRTGRLVRIVRDGLRDVFGDERRVDRVRWVDEHHGATLVQGLPDRNERLVSEVQVLTVAVAREQRDSIGAQHIQRVSDLFQRCGRVCQRRHGREEAIPRGIRVTQRGEVLVRLARQVYSCLALERVCARRGQGKDGHANTNGVREGSIGVQRPCWRPRTRGVTLAGF